jgi:hypothetical protein
MKIPSNIISLGKYTIGNEFVNPKTNEVYQGYYYEISNTFFIGREFKYNAPEIIKISNKNTLLDNPKTKTYSQISNITSQKISLPSYNYIPLFELKEADLEDITRYFIKKLDSNPILIREINKETFDTIKSHPLYQKISITEPELLNPEQIEKQMPGLLAFLTG